METREARVLPGVNPQPNLRLITLADKIAPYG